MPSRPYLIDPDLMRKAEEEVKRIRAEKYNPPIPDIPKPVPQLPQADVSQQTQQVQPPIPQRVSRPDRPDREKMAEARGARYDVITGYTPPRPQGRAAGPGQRTPAYRGQGYLPPGAPGARAQPYQAPKVAQKPIIAYQRNLRALRDASLQSLGGFFDDLVVGSVPGARGPLYERPPEPYEGYTPDYHPGDTGRYDYPPASPAQEIFENYPWEPSDTEGPPPDDIDSEPPEQETPDFPFSVGGGYGGQNYPAYPTSYGSGSGYGRGDWRQWAARMTTWNF